MVDIATVSVIASASVAGLTIVANLVGGERQRRHEADLDFESRVWEKKSDALFDVIQVCRGVADARADGPRERVALSLSAAFEALHAAQPTVEAFASPACRRELAALLQTLRDGGIDGTAEFDVTLARELKEHAIDQQDFEKAVRRRGEERQAMAEAAERMTVDLVTVRPVALRLIDEARASVRRSSD